MLAKVGGVGVFTLFLILPESKQVNDQLVRIAKLLSTKFMPIWTSLQYIELTSKS